MKFRFRHGSLQPEQKSVVKMAGIVESILIQNERIGERADFQKTVPIRGVARQSRNFQAKYDPGSFQTHLGHQLLKSLAVRRRSCGLTEIAVDDNDALNRPAQSDGTLTKIILPDRALSVLKHLAQRGLPNIQVGVSLQMFSIYLFMRGTGHRVVSC